MLQTADACKMPILEIESVLLLYLPYPNGRLRCVRLILYVPHSNLFFSDKLYTQGNSFRFALNLHYNTFSVDFEFFSSKDYNVAYTYQTYQTSIVSYGL